MSTFEQRLKTFTKWPHGNRHAPEYMAAAGFFQNHRVHDHNDAATCFNCEMTLASWATAMDPVKEHLDRSPRCTWITGKMMNTQEKREDTFGDWPFDERLSYILVAAAGFFQSDVQTHTVTCYACQLTLGPEQLGTDPLGAHMRLDNHISPCVYLSKATHPAERALPLTPPLTPPLRKYRCAVCRNPFPTLKALRQHLADPKKAHSQLSLMNTGRVAKPRPVFRGYKRGVQKRKVPSLASRITRPKPKPEYIKVEDDGEVYSINSQMMAGYAVVAPSTRITAARTKW